MNILLTGEPHSGKSTLINKVLERFDEKCGFVTNEDLRNGQRIGFVLKASNGKEATIAHIDYEAELHVSKYGVNPLALDELIKALPAIDLQSILYIDEIGQMQLYSDRFHELVDEYVNAPNDFIGTLSKVYDHELIRKLKKDPNVAIVEVTKGNRDALVEEITSKLIH